ncbi:MAG: 5'-methylthioadenosine/S-adenosylhomocysteine nucleosidase [Thermoanaerobaculia bacterium]
MTNSVPRSPVTLVISAMPSELVPIRAKLEGKSGGTLACFPFQEGSIAGRRTITVVCGVGVTNGAMVTALFAHHFQPGEVVVTGTGSRFNSALETGDVVISKRTIHHAAGSLTEAGMVYRPVRGPLPNTMTPYAYPPDRALFELALSAIKTYEPRSVTANGKTYTPRVLPGIVTASDLFGVSKAKIADMKKQLDPDIMEMESAAIAQVCWQLGLPHIVFRAGSNFTQSDPGEDYRKVGQIAAASAARWTLHFLGVLAEAKN